MARPGPDRRTIANALTYHDPALVVPLPADGKPHRALEDAALHLAE